MPHFCVIGPLEDEGAEAGGIALLLLGRVSPGDDQEIVGNVGQRDPGLLAVEDVAVALLHRRRLDRARIAARRGFGEAVAGNLGALGLRHQVALLLVLGSPRE